MTRATPPPVVCLAYTAARGWHAATVSVEQIVAAELEAYDDLDDQVVERPAVALPAFAYRPSRRPNGFRPVDATGLPQLAAAGTAACGPLAALFDMRRPDEHTARQMAALCVRCPIATDCTVRRTPPMRAAS